MTLPFSWRTRLPWFCVAWDRPAPAGPQVIARCGEAVVAFDRDDGAIRWQVPLDPRAGDGVAFVSGGETVVTEYRRRPERLSTLVAVRFDGTRAWRGDLGGQVSRNGVVIHGDEVYALAREPARGQVLYRLDLASGAVRAAHDLPWPATSLLATDDGFLVANASDDRAPGLYRIAPDGGEHEALLDDPAWWLAPGLAISRHAGTRTLRSLAGSWSTEVDSDVAGTDGNVVVAVRGGALVALATRDGAELWRTDPLPAEAARLAIAGPAVLCGHGEGTTLYRTDDGTAIGATADSYGIPVADDNHVYMGGVQEFVRVDLP